MTITSNAGSRFAYYAKMGWTVRNAWYEQGWDTQQASDRNIARVFGHGGCVNDHLWGYGSVSSDPPAYSSSNSWLFFSWDMKLYND